MFYQKIQVLCKKAGTTPTALCKELKLITSMVTRWRNGTKPHIDTLQKIADYFSISVKELISDDPSSKGVRIPVFGTVAAGIPIEAITDIEDYEEISEALAATGEFVALKIKGNSMEPLLLAGDTVIIRVQDTIEAGEIAVVLVNGEEATCKKIKKTPEGVILISLNSDYDPMFYTNAEIESLPIRIFGKVVEMRRTI